MPWTDDNCEGCIYDVDDKCRRNPKQIYVRTTNVVEQDFPESGRRCGEYTNCEDKIVGDPT